MTTDLHVAIPLSLQFHHVRYIYTTLRTKRQEQFPPKCAAPRFVSRRFPILGQSNSAPETTAPPETPISRTLVSTRN